MIAALQTFCMQMNEKLDLNAKIVSVYVFMW